MISSSLFRFGGGKNGRGLLLSKPLDLEARKKRGRGVRKKEKKRKKVP